MRMRARIIILALSLILALSGVGVAIGAPTNPNGVGGAMPAYYDGVVRTINFKLLPERAQVALHTHNKSFNIVYQSDPGLPGGEEFISVLDAVPGDGFNPIWEEVQITFTEGHTPRQLYSDTEILAAVGNGEITLSDTDEMYRCSVIGKR